LFLPVGAGLLASGLLLVPPSRSRVRLQWLRRVRRVGEALPGHSGGSAPDSHRLP